MKEDLEAITQVSHRFDEAEIWPKESEQKQILIHAAQTLQEMKRVRQELWRVLKNIYDNL